MASLKENWREFIYAMIKREPVWFYDLGGDWYKSPLFHADFRQMHKIYRQVTKEEISWQTPVALFYDEKSCDGVSLTKGDWGCFRPFTMAAEIQRMAALCGVPYDMYELEDIYDLDLSKYKVLYFQNAWRYDAKFAKFLQEKVYPAGKTVIWVYGAGYGQKGGVKGMKEYTGFDFEVLPLGNPLYYKAVDGRMIGYPGMKGTEIFAVKGKANVLGTYENGKTAAAWKKVGKGASFYFAAHDKNGWLMRKVLQQAGINPLVDRSDRVVYDGRNFGLIAVDGPGVRTITLPEGNIARVFDLINGKEVKFEGSSFKVFAAPGDAKLFRIDFK